MIGKYVLSVKVCGGSQFIIQTLKDNCPNLKSIELRQCSKPVQFPKFPNLKELKVSTLRMNIDELRSYFASNPDIESLEYNGLRTDYLSELVNLPKLKSLRFTCNHFNPNQLFPLLNGLTKLSIESSKNCNHLLIELVTKLNLVELELKMEVNAATFQIINSFRNLEVLSITSAWTMAEFLHPNTFPLNLRCKYQIA